VSDTVPGPDLDPGQWADPAPTYLDKLDATLLHMRAVATDDEV
jgi:hypothetical protein